MTTFVRCCGCVVTVKSVTRGIDALGEVTRGMEVVEYATSIPEVLKGEFTEQVGRDIDAYSFRQPLGVGALAGPCAAQDQGDGRQRLGGYMFHRGRP